MECWLYLSIINVGCRAQPTLHQCVVMGVGRVQELCGRQ